MMLQVSGPATSRRREAESLLRERRLLVSRRELGSISQRADDRDTFFHRLAKTCFELGPIFAAFGRYLGTRADLFEAKDAFQLLGIPEIEHFAPLGDTREQLRRVLGEGAAENTIALRESTGTRGLFQVHPASLPDGTAITAQIVPEDLLENLDRDLESLEILKPVFACRGWREAAITKALDTFRQQLTNSLDVEMRAKTLESLAEIGEVCGRWVSPRPHPSLRARGILVLEDLHARPLSRTLDEADPVSARHIALEACAIWLRLALTSSLCPTSLEFGVLEDGGLAVLDGTFLPMPKASGARLWSYLRATAAHDPDHAFGCLEKEIGVSQEPQARFTLRQKVRQAVPFRDGSWTTEADCLSEILMLHWRYLEANGLPAPPHLEGFYGGIFALAARLERRFERPDLLREALEDLEWSAGQAQFRSLFEPTQLGESLNAALSTFAALPQRLDHLLDLLSRDEGPPIRVRPSRVDRRRQNRLVATIALMLFMAGLVLLSGHPDLSARFGEMLEITRTILFALLATGLFILIRGKR